MKITHLVTNGCSWTYGQGLHDPKSEAWPALLAQKFNCEVVNIAMPGSSNDAISRRTMEYVYENLPTNSNPLFVIMFSQIFRREAWFQQIYNADCEDYMTIPYPNPALPQFKSHWENSSTLQEKIYFNEFNEEDFLRNDIYNKIFLKDLLENKNYKYFFTSYQSSEIRQEFIDSLCNRFPNLVKEYNNVLDYEGVDKYTHKIQKTPCGHDDVGGNRIIANILYDLITKKFSNLEFEPSADFLKLKDFKIIGANNNVQKRWENAWK